MHTKVFNLLYESSDVIGTGEVKFSRDGLIKFKHSKYLLSYVEDLEKNPLEFHDWINMERNTILKPARFQVRASDR